MGAISRRGDGSAMRSLLVLAIVFMVTIEFSAQGLTVPRMRKRDLSPPMIRWEDDDELDEPYENLVNEDDAYDYKWDRYDESFDKMLEYPHPAMSRYQKRSSSRMGTDWFKRGKAAREWYTRLG